MRPFQRPFVGDCRSRGKSGSSKVDIEKSPLCRFDGVSTALISNNEVDHFSCLIMCEYFEYENPKINW